MGGEALTASELAAEANITKQTASSHLSKLVEARLLSVQPQGRHRYFRIGSPDVAAMLESIMGVAQRSRTARMLPGPRDPALRRARRCYDHLAGELAVEAYDSFVDRGFIHLTRQIDSKDTLALTPDGHDFFYTLGIDFTHIGRYNGMSDKSFINSSLQSGNKRGLSTGSKLLLSIDSP